MKAKKGAIWMVFLVLLLFVASCSDSPTGQLIRRPAEPEPDVSYDKFISPMEVQKILNLRTVKVIDLRENWKYNSGHIPNSINIPFSEIDGFRLQAEGLDKDFRIIVYDENGMRSRNSYAILTNIGYEKTQIMEGGFESWVAKELTIQQSY